MTVSASAATDLAVCGASVGYGYFPKYGLSALSDESGKWQEEKISSGRITLTVNDADEFDVLIADARGSVFSSRADGAAVIALNVSDLHIAVLVTNRPNYAETYTFFRNADGQAEVMWTSLKYGTLIPKASALRAPCSYFALPINN